ncbi:MAG TPA: hypothetical protein VKA68_19340 [bacterium]|nr:hypothetical protein [bacterium]
MNTCLDFSVFIPGLSPNDSNKMHEQSGHFPPGIDPFSAGN